MAQGSFMDAQKYKKYFKELLIFRKYSDSSKLAQYVSKLTLKIDR